MQVSTVYLAAVYITYASTLLLFDLPDRLLVRRLELRLHLRQHRLMGLVFHAELALALRHTTQVARVSEHVVERDLGRRRELVLAHLAVDDRPATLVQPTDDSALELRWCNDLDGHDRLEDDRPRGVVHLAERADRRKPERELGRVDRVRKTVVEDQTRAADGVARERALLECLVEALYNENY